MARYEGSLCNSSETATLTDIENTEDLFKEFIDIAKNKESGQTIKVNGNLLTIRYDEESDQEWIDVSDVDDKDAIPTQQCSRIVPNREQMSYMLEECFHQWEYHLYPMAE